MGDPHDLEGGALESRSLSISKKRRRQLDAGYDQAEQAGSSQAHAQIDCRLSGVTPSPQPTRQTTSLPGILGG